MRRRDSIESGHRDETLEGAPSEVPRSVAMLAAAASHEINNSLMVIVANLELLERTQALDADGDGRSHS